jgi:uncharacterized membrane protein
MVATADILGQVPIFALLDDQERAALSERVEIETHAEGTTVFKAGDPGDRLYVVCSGKVEIFFKNDTGDRIVLETATAGDFFGEMSLLDGGPRMASALVLEDASLVVVDRGDLDELFRLRPSAAMDMLTATGRRLRETTRLLRHTASRNANTENEDSRSLVMRMADWISEFSGSIPFLMIHVVLFTVWIMLNVKPLADHHLGGFDPFPFGLLTMAVSLEAIILSVFVLLSQNRQIERDRVRNEIEYEVNLKAELEVAQLHVMFEDMHTDMLARFTNIERTLGAPTLSRPTAPEKTGPLANDVAVED